MIVFYFHYLYSHSTYLDMSVWSDDQTDDTFFLHIFLLLNKPLQMGHSFMYSSCTYNIILKHELKPFIDIE